MFTKAYNKAKDIGAGLVRNTKAIVAAGVVGVGAMTTNAAAQYTPPDLNAVVYPFGLDQATGIIVTAGTDMINAALPFIIGFGIVWAVIYRVRSSF